jgi:hypothetical protein
MIRMKMMNDDGFIVNDDCRNLKVERKSELHKFKKPSFSYFRVGEQNI